MSSQSAVKHGVTSAPSVLVIDDGREVARLDGMFAPEDLLALVG